MKFTGDEAQTVTRGKWNYQAVIGTGSITISYSVGGNAFMPVTTGVVTSGVISADSTDNIELSTCRFKAGLTGDSTFIMTKA